MYSSKPGKASERGAALITTLLLSALVLMAGSTLILTTSMSATTTLMSTAELQAFYGAEAGLQAALNVLRGNVNPDAAIDASTMMSFRNAVTLATSNLPTDTSTDSRLSAWLDYDATYTDRVPLTTGYTLESGIAYKVVITDPDNTAAPTDPSRLIIEATGYGPRGATKRLQLMVQRYAIDFNLPAAVTLRGADDGSAPTIDTGSSGAKEYSGVDNAGVEAQTPSFAIVASDLAEMQAGIKKPDTVEDPDIGILDVDDPGALPSVETPPFLQTADAARSFLDSSEALARKESRYFNSLPADIGTPASPKFTFVDGDIADLPTGGAGLLICTGTLTASGNPSFNGAILVLGEGEVYRDGGGNGNILGGIIVAKFERSWPVEENELDHDFLAPVFSTTHSYNVILHGFSVPFRQQDAWYSV
jgi:hypothetical protein